MSTFGSSGFNSGNMNQNDSYPPKMKYNMGSNRPSPYGRGPPYRSQGGSGGGGGMSTQPGFNRSTPAGSMRRNNGLCDGSWDNDSRGYKRIP